MQIFEVTHPAFYWGVMKKRTADAAKKVLDKYGVDYSDGEVWASEVEEARKKYLESNQTEQTYNSDTQL